MKTPFLHVLIAFLTTLSILSQGQPESNIVPTYNVQQLDSILLELRKEFYQANYEKIVEQAPRLLQNAEEVNALRTKQRITSLLGNAFIQFDAHQSAHELFIESLKEAQSAKDTAGILGAYINLGNTYIFRDPKKAINYFKSGTEYLTYEDSGDATNFNDRASFILHNNLAELYVGIKQSKEAQFYLDKAHSFLSLPSLVARKSEYMAAGYYIQGAIDLLEQRNDSAISNTSKALSEGKGLLDENYILGSYKILIEAYANIGKYEKVNTIRVAYDSLRDRRYQAEKIRQQQIATSKFNLENYKRQLRETLLANEVSQQKALKNKILFIFTAVLGGVLTLLISLLLYSGYKRNRLMDDLKEKNRLYLDAKEVSEKLAKSNTRFLSTISHELRTPLYGIIGLSSVLLKNEQMDSNSHEEIKSLKFSADYLLSLVNDVLHINKFESEEGKKLQNDHFVLATLIKDIVQTFEFNNKKNNNTVHLSIDKDIPKVLQGDKMKLSQVLMNLISNASKFTQDGAIDVIAELECMDKEAVSIRFVVKDTGAGIPLEEQDTIFDEFTQVKRASHKGGTGLGLPIVNKILHILNSKLLFESVLGKGTTFNFTLALQEGSMKDMEDTVLPHNFDSLKNKKVLIVDDNKINRLVTQKVLTLYNIRFDVAKDGLEAVEKVKNDVFDTVLMDINMPNMNGFDASKEIRTFNKVVPIIALTASTYDTLGDQLSDFGIDDAMVKPYDTEMLLNALIRHIHLKKRYPFEGVSHRADNDIKYSV
ncbi:MAG: response regulator [Croceivirga sp.]